MSAFICPVCKAKLVKNGDILNCKNGHCFDISSKHYVNLLMSQKSSKKRHGDDKLMINSRTAFLNKGYYKPLRDAVCSIVNRYSPVGAKILDAGCGEGYYTAGIYDFLLSAEKRPEICGIDISKEALTAAAKHCPDCEFAVAGITKIPIEDKGCDIVLNMFAPHSETEFSRILSDDGVLIRVVPLERHLYGLKKKIYKNPYLNEPENKELKCFMLTDCRELKYSVNIENRQDIENLFKMTPYYYKTGIDDQNRLLNQEKIETEIEFGILVYKKETCNG